MKTGQGTLVVSLDFELYWGMRDRKSLKEYGPNIIGARKAVPAILGQFEKHGIRATWATVGLLFFDNKEDMLRFLPDRKPVYDDARISPYEYLKSIGGSEEEDPYHFGASLISKILSYQGQEVGGHTFSHYYCMEKGQTVADFRADVEASVRVAREWGLSLDSLVFPRNQYDEEYISVLRENGFHSYRGAEESWLYKARPLGRQKFIVLRIARLMDNYINLSGHNTYTIDSIRGSFPYNIASSRFLRPHMESLGFLEPLQLRRIKSAMTHAAKNGMVFHLWWHPHNFGGDVGKNISLLEDVLGHYDGLREKYGMRSRNMADITGELRQLEGEG